MHTNFFVILMLPPHTFAFSHSLPPLYTFFSFDHNSITTYATTMKPMSFNIKSYRHHNDIHFFGALCLLRFFVFFHSQQNNHIFDHNSKTTYPVTIKPIPIDSQSNYHHDYDQKLGAICVKRFLIIFFFKKTKTPTTFDHNSKPTYVAIIKPIPIDSQSNLQHNPYLFFHPYMPPTIFGLLTTTLFSIITRKPLDAHQRNQFQSYFHPIAIILTSILVASYWFYDFTHFLF